jgi:pimeloyl-ACP methyl ester carboxylesterase
MANEGKEMRTAARWTLRLIVALLLFVFVALACLRLAAAWRESADASPPSDGRMVSTAKGEIFVQVRGPDSGVPVILVPGTAAWSGFWLGVADDLGAGGYRAVAVDLPPFGFSARSAEGAYSRADQAARLAALIDALGLKRSIVVGHSFGAGAVVELAMARPDALAGMVLVDPALGLPADGQSAASDPILRWALDQPVIAQTLVAATLDNPLLTRPLLASLLFRKEAATQRQADILAVPYARAGTTAAYARWLPHLLLPETSAMSATPSAYAKIKTPTAMIWGARDTVTPLEQGERLLQLIPGSTLEVIADAGHIPHIEDQADFPWVLKRALTSIVCGPLPRLHPLPPHLLQHRE